MSVPGDELPQCWAGVGERARADKATVRLCDTGRLVRIHPRQAPGGRSTDLTDVPTGKSGYVLRDLVLLINIAAGQGQASVFMPPRSSTTPSRGRRCAPSPPAGVWCVAMAPTPFRRHAAGHSDLILGPVGADNDYRRPPCPVSGRPSHFRSPPPHDRRPLLPTTPPRRP